jgi:hypothetical protein
VTERASTIDVSDQLTVRLVMAVGVLMNLLDCLDDLGIEPRAGAQREAEAILRALGPAAVTCALLQGSETLRRSPHAEGAVNLFVETALRRRESFLAAFPLPQRRAIEQREGERQCGPDHVLQLFAEALSGMKEADVLQRWGSGGGLEQLSAAIAGASEGEDVDLDALRELAGASPRENGEAEDKSGGGDAAQTLPEDLLEVVGGVLAGVGADAHMLDRVLAGVITPTSVPEGYDADAVGTVRRTSERVGRNDPCPCGSGRKFKKCCGP